MDDTNLIAFGCGVSFIAFAGVYVYVREGFLASERRKKAQEASEGRQEAKPGEAASPA